MPPVPSTFTLSVSISACGISRAMISRFSCPPGRNRASIGAPGLRCRLDHRADPAQRLEQAAGRGRLRVGLHAHDGAADAAHRFREARRDDLAEGIVRDQRCEPPLALLGGMSDDARHLWSGLEAQEVNAVAGHLAVVGEGDHRDVGLARDRRHGSDGLGEQRTQDQLGAALDRLVGSSLRALGRALVVLDDQLHARAVALEQGKLARLLEALADDPGLAMGRQRHEQRHLDLVALVRCPLGRGCRSRRR